MRTMLSMAVALILSAAASCASAPPRSERLQWSDGSVYRSPDGLSKIEVKADLTGSDNNSLVTFRKGNSKSEQNIFILKRNADLYWAKDSKFAVIVNHPFDGESEIIVVPTIGVFNTNSTRDIDNKLNQKLKKEFVDAENLHIRKFDILEWNGDLLKVNLSGRYELKYGNGSVANFAKKYVVNLDKKTIE